MRLFLAATVLVGCVPSAGAQARMTLTAGLTSSSTLVDDGVLRSKLRPATAPSIGIAIALPTGKGPYNARIEAHYSRSTLRVADADAGVTDDLGSLATIDAAIMAEGPVTGKFRWQVGAGAIFYRPAEREGVFQDGPEHRWLVTGGVSWSHPLSRNLRLVFLGRVDSHTFTTETLRARGYTGAQGVQRVGLHAGIERTF